MNLKQAYEAATLRILRGTQAHALASIHNTNAAEMFARLCDGDHALAEGRPVQYAHGHLNPIQH